MVRDRPRAQGDAMGRAVLLIAFSLAAGVFTLRFFFIDLALVEGRSMEPSLSHGDVVVLLKAAYGLKSPGGRYLFSWSRPRTQELVAVRKPGDSNIVIKRVSYVLMDSTVGYSVFVLGDNLYESIDSRDFGTVPMNNILGKVLLFPRF
ncbi:MAG: hypothetical protein FD137_1913 [Spirochaetes bacterium]|nr:MAG: hypothetical protein FD137_1913 [Spirochaetota bacterium]